LLLIDKTTDKRIEELITNSIRLSCLGQDKFNPLPSSGFLLASGLGSCMTLKVEKDWDMIFPVYDFYQGKID